MYVLTAAAIFIAIVSIDLFAGGLAFGATRTKISFVQALIVNVIGKIAIGIALVSGYYLGRLIPELVGIMLCFVILTSIGLYKIFHPIIFRNRPEKNIKKMTWWQSVLLGLALSFDGIGMAFGTTVADMPFYFIYVVLGTMLVTDQVILLGSNRLGLYLSNRKKALKLNLDWLAGLILIIVATVKMILELLA